MKKTRLLRLSLLVLPVLGSCGPSENEGENNDPTLTREEINEQNMEYVIPYLRQSFTLTGTFYNGVQNFNLTYIYQTTPYEARYKHFEYLDEEGNPNGQQSVEVYYEDEDGKAKAYIAEPDNTTKSTNVYSQSTSEEVVYSNLFFNPFAVTDKDDFLYDEDKVFLDSTIYRNFVDSIYGISNDLPEDVYAYFTFDGRNIDKFIFEFTLGDKEIKYDLKFSKVSNSRIEDMSRKHYPIHDKLDEAFANLASHLNKANPDTFLLEVKQDLGSQGASVSSNSYFLGDSIYIEMLSPMGWTNSPYEDDFWLIKTETGTIDTYTYDIASSSFKFSSHTSMNYEDYLPRIAFNEVASEVFDYVGDNQFLACKDVLASIGNKFVDASLVNLDRVGDEYRIKINDNNEIDTIYFSYNKLIPISGSIRYLDFNNVDVPQEFLDLKPII